MTNEPRLTSLAHGGGCGCKIAPDVLAEILRGTPALPVPPELIVGMETSDDAAVWMTGPDQAIVATTDFFMPIVDDPFDFGRIAATNAISDIYAMGARPAFALAIVAMPVSRLSQKTISEVLAGGSSVCQAAGIPIAGGHTIDSVEPIYGLAVMGLAHPSGIRTNRSARPGDVLVLGKPIGVGIYSSAFKKEALDQAAYQELIATTTKLNTPGPEIAGIAGVHALTDVTGFGLAGHVLELARGSGCAICLEWNSIPLLSEARKLASEGFITGASARNLRSYGAALETGPLGEIDKALLSDPQTSGGLLVSCSPEAAGHVLSVFRDHGFSQAAIIGRVETGSGVTFF